MGKNKLKKFGEMAELDFVYQYPFGVLKEHGFPLKGKWHEEVFGNDNPIVLELGCGKGEYTVGLARRFPDRNYIGIDIKGARMWTGAKQAEREALKNVAFIRTDIELLPEFFAPGEVAEIWITFCDPQMKKARKRLTSTRFMELYRKVMKDGGVVNLKSDSPFLYTYTRRMVGINHLPMLHDASDLYGSDLEMEGLPEGLREIRTHYENQWLQRGLSIKYLSWLLPHDGALVEPREDDIEQDTYRSYSRGYIQGVVTEDDGDDLTHAINN